MKLFETGIRPAIDEYLAEQAKKVRDYGDYWSASSAGYCMRKNILERLQVPCVNEDARKTRVFASGHIFHGWVQKITKNAGLSQGQEREVWDRKLMIRGHVDDLVLVDGKLILYDYKTAHSRSFHYAKDRPISYYHKMQVGTYMHMVRQLEGQESVVFKYPKLLKDLSEARVLKISKDDLCMDEKQVLWTPQLEKEVLDYWQELGLAWEKYQNDGTLPPCTCADHEGGFMSKPQYNPFFYEGEPCSEAWLKLKLKEKS